MKNLAFVALLCIASVALGDLQCAEQDRHPIIFFPGIFGSRLEEKYDIPSSVPLPHSSCERQSKDWEPAWVEWKKVFPFSRFDCLAQRLSMHPNDAGDQWSNTEGVEYRVPYWGSVKSVDPLCEELGKVIRMYGHAMDSLQKFGYEDGKTLFVASYDWRRMPTPEWKEDVREMIEKAVFATGKKAVIYSHSMGCPVSYMFLMSQTAEWRQKFIEHYLPASPVWSGTNIIPFAMVTNKILNITVEPFASIGTIFRDLEGAYVLAPSLVYAPDTVVAETNTNVYTAKNASVLLERVGVKNAQVITDNIQKQLYQYKYEHPGVPVTTFWSTGVPTLGVFSWSKDSDIGKNEPVPHFIDGDGLVPHDSLVYAYNIWSNGPHADITEGYLIPDTNHGTMTANNLTLSYVFKAACDSA